MSLTIGLQGSAGAAGFDCSKPSAPVEQLICGDPVLSRLDGELAARFTVAKNAHPDLRQPLIQAQRDWLNDRLEICAIPARAGKDAGGSTSLQRFCLKTLYEDRIVHIDQFIAEPARSPIPNPTLAPMAGRRYIDVLLDDVTAPLPDDLAALDSALAASSSPAAKVGRLFLLLELFDDPVAREKAGRPIIDAYISSTGSVGTEWHKEFMSLLEKFDGSETSLIRVLHSVRREDAEKIHLSCKFTFENQSAIILYLDRFYHSPYHPDCYPRSFYHLPALDYYREKLKKYGEVDSGCERTSRDRWAGQEWDWDVVRAGLSLSPIAIRSLDNSDRSPLDLWRLFNAWNGREFIRVQAVYRAAVRELTEHYSRNLQIRAEDAPRYSYAAIRRIHDVFPDLPLPKRDPRYMTLTGEPWDRMSEGISQTPPDSFLEGDRYFTQYHFGQYRWPEHRYRIGPPDPLLLISVVRPEIMARLLDLGEDPNQANRLGKTPLMMAAHLDLPEAVRLLLERGASANAQSGPPKVSGEGNFGCLLDADIVVHHGHRTALMYAAENASAELIDVLLAAGADPCIADSEGLRPLDYFEGRAPSKDINWRIADPAVRSRISRALACPAPPLSQPPAEP